MPKARVKFPDLLIRVRRRASTREKFPAPGTITGRNGKVKSINDQMSLPAGSPWSNIYYSYKDEDRQPVAGTIRFADGSEIEIAFLKEQS